MRFLSAFLFAAVFALHASAADEKIKVLIIDGQNNHNWQQTTPVLKKIFEGTNRFTVDVATSPPAKSAKDVMAKFLPDLSKYQVVVSNYNGEPWGKELNDSFDALLKEGKIGFVVVHAANNAFGGWKEYNQMIGMGWRDAKFGKRLKYDDDKEVIVDAGADSGSGHRYTGPFTVKIRDTETPITKGMPKEWLHVQDELYDNMRGPIENVHVLATAYSNGTKTSEPMIWTVSYGKGRVFHTPMGHDATAMRCWGFAGTVTRGTEWAATGKVTLPLPKEFPTADKTSPIREK